MTKPILTLKKISHDKRLSEETPAYTAQVWADGVHVCDVSNHGQGGPDMQYPAKGKTQADIDALNARIKATYPKNPLTGSTGEDLTYDTDLELACHLELERVGIEKTVKRDLNTKIMFVKPADGFLYGVSKKGVPPQQVAKLIEIIKQKHGCTKVLNEMTLAEAVEVYMKVAA